MPTIAVSDDAGCVSWFNVTDATAWESDDGNLYEIQGRFVLRDALSIFTSTPAKFVDETTALLWLVSRGHDVPPSLTQFAEPSRLRSVYVPSLEVDSYRREASCVDVSGAK